MCYPITLSLQLNGAVFPKTNKKKIIYLHLCKCVFACKKITFLFFKFVITNAYKEENSLSCNSSSGYASPEITNIFCFVCLDYHVYGKQL